MILYTLLFTPQVNKLLCFDKPPHGYEYELLQRYIHSSSTNDTVTSL